MGGYKYFTTLVDVSIKCYYIYMNKNKNEAIEKYALYIVEVENNLNRKVKVLRSNGEYEFPFD